MTIAHFVVHFVVAVAAFALGVWFASREWRRTCADAAASFRATLAHADAECEFLRGRLDDLCRDPTRAQDREAARDARRALVAVLLSLPGGAVGVTDSAMALVYGSRGDFEIARTRDRTGRTVFSARSVTGAQLDAATKEAT